MRSLMTIAIALATLAAPGPASQQSPESEWEAPAETKDRLTDAEIERLVARPMARVRKNDLSGGIAIFENMLHRLRDKKGGGRVEAADFITAFGVQLYLEFNDSEDPAIREASLKYMRDAVEAYRAAFGPVHPEVALALNSYADVMYNVSREGEVPGEVIHLLKESLDQRLATLGPDNAETRANMTKLANRIVAKSKGDPEASLEAEGLYRRALVNAPITPDADNITGAVPIRLALARLLSDGGKTDDALRELELVLKDASTWPDDARCWRVNPKLEEIAQIFTAQGKTEAVEKVVIIAKGLSCEFEGVPVAIDA